MYKQLVMILLGIIFFGVTALAQEEPMQQQPVTKSWNTVCPVEGNPVNPEIKTIKHAGKEYGFCGASCAVVFNEDPAYHVANLSEDGTAYTGQQKSKESQY